MIEQIFPTLLYKTNLSDIIDNEILYQRALHYKNTVTPNCTWDCDTFTTINVVNLAFDRAFDTLVKQCSNHVIEFSKEFGVESNEATCLDAWVNVAGPGNYQEYHLHSTSHFSLAYYVKAPENCGNIVFKSHEPDMFPLPVSKANYANYKHIYHVPKVGDLVIFRSNLLHMVQKNKSNEDRVSVSMNFVL